MITKNRFNSIINDPTLSDLDNDIYNECIVKKGDYQLKSFVEWESILREHARTEGLDYFLREYYKMYDYLKEGNILWHIWNNNLWKEDQKYDNFEDFCENGLGKIFLQVKKTINASAIATNLIKLGFAELPQSLNVAIALEILKKEGTNTDSYQERLKKVWTQVLRLPKFKRSTIKVKEIIKSTYPDLFGDKKKKYRGFA